jgi:hypothetical protein
MTKCHTEMLYRMSARDQVMASILAGLAVELTSIAEQISQMAEDEAERARQSRVGRPRKIQQQPITEGAEV